MTMELPTPLNRIDRNIFFLVVTLLIIAGYTAAHNVMLTEDDAMSFGMCDVSLHCQGVESGDLCIGIEYRQTSCVDPADAEQYRHAEAECGLDAQAICNANPSLEGMEWLERPNASYEGRPCEDWAAQDDRIDLLSCEDTFNDITQWD